MNLNTRLIKRCPPGVLFFRYLTSFMLLVVFVCIPVYAQETRSVSGTVMAEGEELVGASVVEKGTTNGTMTDVNGRFTLQVKPDAELLISYLGYDDLTVKVGNQTVLHIELKENPNMLDEVVAVGYGVQQKKLLTGATVQVKGEDIARLNTVSALGALQSQTAGVNIIKSSGKPGDGYKVVIRGLGTVGTPNPLYVVDGVPAGTNDDVMNNLNPADIESVDVLKDAASAAIYGSSGANGVILITTKRGKKGKASIQYDGYIGWQNVYKKANPLNAQQYMDIYNESIGADTEDPNRYDKFLFAMLPEDQDRFLSGEWNGTNWLEEMINKNAPITNHSLNITGGSDASVYSIGLSYTSQSPVIGVKNEEMDPRYERYNLRINTEHNLIKHKDFDVLQFGQTLQMNYKNSKSMTMATSHTDWNDVHSALVANPLYSVYREDGSFADSGWNSTEDNPIARMYYNSFSQGKSYAARGNFYFVIQPIKNLKYRPSLGYNYSGWTSRSFVPEYELNHTKHNYTQAQQSSNQGLDWTIDNVLSYDFSIRKDHSFSAMLGTSAERSGLGEHVSGTTVDLQFKDFEHAFLNNGTTSGTDSRVRIEGYPWDWRGSKVSYFGRLNYDYQGTYMATVIFRRDGSSKFARGYRWGTFPSFSAGWTVSNEHFMERTQSWLDYLKIRGGWGKNGNDNVRAFRYAANVAFMTGAGGYAFGSDKTITTNGAYITNVPNPGIRWETSEQVDIGFDSWFFKNSLGINFDYYQKNTVDWIINPPAVGTNGTGSPYVNGGKVRNRGIELMLTWQGQHAASGFNYSVTANMTYNKNKVMDVPNDEKVYNGPTGVLGQNTDILYKAQAGYPVGYFYGYKANGIIQTEEEAAAYDAANKMYMNGELVTSQPGDIKYVDINKDGVIDANDRTMIGDPNPDLFYGLTISFAWKGFDLAVTGNGVAGNQIAKSYRSYVTQSYENYTTDILGRWHGAGTSNKLPRLGEGSIARNWSKISDQIYIEDGDYFRIGNMTLGYDFKHLFKNSPLFSQLRIYGAVQNLVTFTKYSGMDPEVGSDGSTSGVSWARGVDIGYYPSARTFLVGVSIKY